MVTQPRTSDYTSAFPRPRNPAIYDESIDNNEKAPVRAQKEETHKSWRSDYATFESMEWEAGKFILSVVEYTWV